MLRALLFLLITGFATSLANAGDGELTAAQAKSKVLNLDDDAITVGTQVDFPGGYYKVVDQGHELNREDLHCRKIMSVAHGDSSTKIYCFRNRELDWVNVDAQHFVVDPIQSASLRPAGSQAGAQH